MAVRRANPCNLGRVIKGTRYFLTFKSAEACARTVGTDRIIRYDRGWAVQYRKSGPYVSGYSKRNRKNRRVRRAAKRY